MRYRESLRGFIPRQMHILRFFTPTPEAVNGTFMNENCVYIDDLMKVYEVMYTLCVYLFIYIINMRFIVI